MNAARFLLVALLPLLAACVASAPPDVWESTTAMPNASSRLPEKTFRVSGYVFDAVSRKPVPGVVVGDEYYWVMGFKQFRTDTSGHFVLQLPVSLRKKNRQLEVHTMLYEGQAVIPADTTQQVTLLLKRNAYRFKPYGCQVLADSVLIPPYASIPILALPGSQSAFLIRDSTIRQPRKLRALTFRVGKYGFPREIFRIRIYQYKGSPEAPPGEDLLLENFIVCPDKEGAFTYDVSPYDIMVSGAGFFLAVEYVVGSDKFYCNYPVVDYAPVGPLLHLPCARADFRTWQYLINKGWYRAIPVENCAPLYHQAIQVELMEGK